jgi:gamma-glutamyltranspeptidase/glutathione hydrolase
MLAVAEPGNSGLGGGGFALVYDPATQASLSFDFREQAPIALDTTALITAVRNDANALRNGALAVAVPSEWDGLLELHRRYGRLPMHRLAAAAIAAAKDGIAISVEHSARCFVRMSVLRKSPEARRTYLNGLGLCPFAGSILRQPELANTIEELSREDHPRSFNDLVGKKMVALLRAQGSSISEADLTRDHVKQRPVVSGSFMGRRIVSMGPPSSGGTIVIGLLQAYERMRIRFPQANRLHLWTQAARLVFRDRAELFGDPDFVAVPTDRLLSTQYATQLAARVDAQRPLDLPTTVPSAREGDHTTHVSIIDRNGMAIALTLTINVPFGSGLIVPGTGVLLNNQMDDFFVDRPNSFGLVGNANNAPAPGKRPLSSMAPTFVFAGNQLQLVLGSPGGSAIPSAVAQVIRNIVEGQMDPERAVRRGRIHHQWLPDMLQVEPYVDHTMLPTYAAEHIEKPMFPIGRVQLVARTRHGLRGVSDCRDQGTPWYGAL